MVEAALLEGIHALDISPPAERLLDSRGLRLRWLDWGGGGVNLVFLHGGALTANSWELVCLALRDRFRCVALDARGHGWSEYSDELAYRLEDHVFDVEALLGEIGEAPSIVIGHSMGAFVGIALAARNQLAGLILVDAAPGVDLEVARAHLEPLRLLDQRAPVEELLERGGLADPSRDRRLIERALLHNVVAQPDGTWMWRHDRRFDWYREFSSRLEYLDSLTPSITCPVLVVRPTRSRALSPAAVARLVARLARGRSVEIEGSGHNVQSDQPLRLAAAIEDFVRLEIQASSE